MLSTDAVRYYSTHAVEFVEDVIHATPDEQQAQILQSVVVNPMTTVRSGHGVGKSAVEAWCLIWFICTHPFPKIPCTAPTQHQLFDILWAEVSKWMRNNPLLEKELIWTREKLYMRGYPEEWFAVARTASKPDALQGFHAEHLLYIIDEASGVDDSIFEPVLGSLSTPGARLLMCGNPTQLSGFFYESHTKNRASYSTFHIDGRQSSRVPQDFIDTIAVHIGCDVARFGDDKTVIGYKVDEKVTFYKKRQGQDTMRTADDIILLGEQLVQRYRLTDPIPIKIDDGGVGGGVVDRLRQVKRNDPERFWWMDIIPVKFGQRIKHKYYHDTTTYMMAVVKSLLQPYDDEGNKKPVELILPDDDDMVAQISGRKYTLTEASKIRIESKDAVKKRGQPSPDEADCVLLLCLPVKPAKKKGVRGNA